MHPDPTKDNHEPIAGWQAIAAHLRVEKTTAQRWERHNGLPVHRLPGKRGGVYARAQELDEWRLTNEQEHAAAAAAADTPAADGLEAETPAAAPLNGAWLDEGRAHARRVEISDEVLTLRVPLRWKWWWAAGVALAAVMVWAAMAWFPRTPPAAFRMEGATLVVTNASGRELWRHAFPAALRPQDPRLGRNAWLGELAHGEPFRVLFPLEPPEGGADARLSCLDPRGRAEWEFVPPAGFEVEAFRVFAAKDRDQSRIVVSSADPWESANQVASLDGNGRLTGQYWHAGRLGYVADANLDRDDPVDVLLSGVDEAHKQATIVGFDRHRFDRGAMPKLVVLFPRSCLAEMLGPYNRACEMVWRGGMLRVKVREGASENSPSLIYEFDQSMRPRSVVLSAEYLERRRELEIEGRLNHSCEGEAERLLDAVRVTWRGTLGE
jgi:hypothetical protein